MHDRNSPPRAAPEDSAAIAEARRQLRICNACRYCEGYCAAFQAITRRRDFDGRDILQLANLCHDCRGCYYSCQYAPPHEFALNLPRALAEVRRESWERFAFPQRAARLLQRHGVALLALALAGGLALALLASALGPAGGPAFYAVLSHGWMVAIFLPAFLVPLGLTLAGLRGYWRAVGGERVRPRQLRAALDEALRLRNLGGGHGEGCNFERGERFSLARRRAHHLVLWGFVLCFASTASATVMHYLFAMPAPYPPLSVPKLFGVPGGVMLLVGALWMAALRLRAERAPADGRAFWAGMAFVLLLAAIAASGLLLWLLRDTAGLLHLLTLVHLATVLAFFLSLPFTRMAHAPFRFAALLRDMQEREAAGR